MKTKQWIKELSKLNPEKELYFHINGDGGEDWGCYIPNPIIEVQVLAKKKYSGRMLIYEDGEGKSLGECNVVTL
jgi:hypothetical protein